MLSGLRVRLRALLRKAEVERELDEELRFHLEKETEQNLARGMGPEEARRAALVSFGGVERVKEESRDVRGFRLFEELWQDLRFGARRECDGSADVCGERGVAGVHRAGGLLPTCTARIKSRSDDSFTL